jgi:uncharacterized protein YifE (UPF0438 family)
VDESRVGDAGSLTELWVGRQVVIQHLAGTSGGKQPVAKKEEMFLVTCVWPANSWRPARRKTWKKAARRDPAPVSAAARDYSVPHSQFPRISGGGMSSSAI